MRHLGHFRGSASTLSKKFSIALFWAGPLDCEFEKASSPKCHWSNVNGKKNWIRHSKRTRSSRTGPTGDISQGLKEGMKRVDFYYYFSAVVWYCHVASTLINLKKTVYKMSIM